MGESYDVHGLGLNVEVESELLARPVDRLLGPFATDACGERPFSFRIEYGIPGPGGPPPEGMRLFWEGELPGGIEMAFYTGDGVRLAVQPGEASVRIDLERRQGRAIVRPGAEGAVGYGCLIPVLSAFLAEVGHHVVHAASLGLPDSEGGGAVLVAGEAGAGKTTTALALAGAGLELLTDDASVVTADGVGKGAVRVWGLPRACKVHDRTLAMLPWLADIPRIPCGNSGEHILELENVSRVDPHDEWGVRLVLLSDGPNPDRHRLTRLDRVAALMRLTGENVRAVDPRSEGSAGRAFAVLAKLVAGCPAYALSAGPDVTALPDQILPLLRD
jgi:hypothetical protein